MSARDALQQLIAERRRGRLLLIGMAASLAWLVLAALFAALTPEGDGQDSGWLIWTVGLLMPLALIWLAVWSARSLSLLRDEADELRAMLDQMQESRPERMPEPMPTQTPARQAAPVAEPPRPAAARPPPAMPRAPAQAAATADGRQAQLQLDSPPVTELTAPELFFALNFPDGPEDREAIRCLRLALADPGLARLIRAAQDVVTLLAGQGVFMDELPMPETDADLWLRFAEGARGDAVAGLAVITDREALETAAAMLQGDEVFRDVAHHFLRHFDRLLNRKAEERNPQLLAVLAATRSGRAFTLLAQVAGMLGPGAARKDPDGANDG
ncbi:hypothetical protein SAMN04487972_12316 [Paracoccus halophilus]|uniref:Uncharacterized protein n=1 Tax=Paracoccus halophilus TaxID=376733 RepID=A0A099EYU0_9RHOB|nr:hypothetical protein [Paracoccus halophilus]KGJ03151.1 hypothetical protein IT41_15080 [Paracoccus halophilus]SFA59091.1 hypothetical protein SAMN04487972_12316 [Paracoccus halophilus]